MTDKKPKDRICPICGNLYDYSPKCHHNQNELIAFEQGKLAGFKEGAELVLELNKNKATIMEIVEKIRLKSQIKEDGEKHGIEI